MATLSPFELVITRLDSFGAFQFLFPFMIAAAVFYGLLRRGKIFGEPAQNVAVNAVVALLAAFMVSAYPILAGVDVKAQFATFFFNSVVAILTVVVGLMLAGMFFEEDIAKQISAKLGGKILGPALIIGIVVAVAIFVSSGLVNVFIPSGLFGGSGGVSGPAISEETILTLGALGMLGIIMFLIVNPTGFGKGNNNSDKGNK